MNSELLYRPSFYLWLTALLMLACLFLPRRTFADYAHARNAAMPDRSGEIHESR